MKASRVPNITAVNVAIQCDKCDTILAGNAYWSIRKTAHLHASNCTGATFTLDAMLAQM